MDYDIGNLYEKKLNQIFGKKYKHIKEKSIIERMVNDLNRLIGALEIYIKIYINTSEIKYFNPDIGTKYFDKIISFNYSATYERMYDVFHYSEYDFVHGKAKDNISFFSKCENAEKIRECIQKNAEANNMVLGIDEYLPEDKRNKELNFIQLKKYYQRIYKRTGNKYKKWLQEIDEDAKNEIESTLYIFGHSLDVTDGDILRDLINHTGLRTVIFYKNKKQLEQQIVNLVKILGSDTLIKKTYGEEPDISFQLQKDRENISSNKYEIEKKMVLLEGAYKNHDLSHLNINDIADKIHKKELGYFRSQENVISLYEILRITNLHYAEGIKKSLLEIAFQLKPYKALPPKRNLNKDISQYMEQFINLINLDNEKRKGI